MTKEVLLKINVTDWNEAFDELLKDEEIDFSSEPAFIRSLTQKYGLSSRAAGEAAVMAKEKGLVDFWPEHKTVLSRGANAMMLGAIARQKVDKEINGKHYLTREYVGYVRKNDLTMNETHNNHVEELEDSQSEYVTHELDAQFISIDTDPEKGAERAEEYLFNRVPGHIKERMKIMQGYYDLKEIGERLKDVIDDIVSELG